MNMPITQVSQPVKDEAFWRELDALLPAGEVRPATAADVIDGIEPSRVVEPASTAEVAQVLTWATGNGVVIVPRGGATKMTWGNRPAAADVVLSTRLLNQVVEHAWEDMTVVTQAGCTMASLQSKLAEHGQHLALDVLWPEQATVGGVIAANDSGALRIRYGGVRDLIIGATVVLSDGTIAKSGGKVVKNVAGYDLQKLMTGALGTLGVITEAIFRLHPKARETRSLTFRPGDITSTNELLVRIHDSQLVPTGMQVRTDSSGHCALDIRFEGIAEGVQAQVATLDTISDLPHTEADPQVWSARERLWSGERAVICKISVLPAQIAEVCKMLRGATERWSVLAQSVGLITARLDSASPQQVLALRHAIATLAGSLVVLECPTDWKIKFDVWGSGGDALALMVRVKQQFDPAGTLNRGRFVGGI